MAKRPGRPRKPAGKRRDYLYTLKVTRDERHALRRFAAAQNRDLADILRESVRAAGGPL